MLPIKAIIEFIEIHQKNTGITLSVEEATSVAQSFFDGMTLLFNYKDTVAKPINK